MVGKQRESRADNMQQKIQACKAWGDAMTIVLSSNFLNETINKVPLTANCIGKANVKICEKD